MKVSWILIFLLVSGSLVARAERPKNCRFLHNFIVMQKIGDNSYEINMQGLGVGSHSETALLTTTKSKFESSGRASLSVVPVGKRKTTMKDGFEKLLQAYQEAPECEGQPKTTTSAAKMTAEETAEVKQVKKIEEYQWLFNESTESCEADEDGATVDFKGNSKVLSQSGERIVFRNQNKSSPNYYYISKEACKSDKDRDLQK